MIHRLYDAHIQVYNDKDPKPISLDPTKAQEKASVGNMVISINNFNQICHIDQTGQFELDMLLSVDLTQISQPLMAKVQSALSKCT